jgi:DNA-binding MarR family transcriptional regulator
VRLDPAKLYAGLPAKAARDLLRWLQDRYIDPDVLAERLKIDRAAGEELMSRLLKEGLIEQSDEFKDRRFFRTTINGNALGNASLLKAISRERAQRELDALCERADEVNADRNLLLWVTRIVVFGSFTDPAVDFVGDVDVAATTVRRFGGDGYTDRVIAYSEASGRRFKSDLEMLFWPAHEVDLRLKNRSRYLSLHRPDQVERLGVAAQVVYEYPRSESI